MKYNLFLGFSQKHGAIPMPPAEIQLVENRILPFPAIVRQSHRQNRENWTK